MARSSCSWLNVTLAATLAVFLATTCPSAVADNISTKRTQSVLVRFAPEHLAAAHADAARYDAQRVSLPPMAGLTDYRAIIHVHADDSAHTGGTLPELLGEARRAGVQVVMLSDHFRPPRDFMDGWRGLRDGVLFIPGSETQGFLVYPDASIMDAMDGPKDELIAATTAGTGLIFLSHVEERLDHPMDGLTGMEIYNRHADASDDMALFMAILSQMTDPAQFVKLEQSLAAYHCEVLGTQLEYMDEYLDKWDVETQKQRVVGISANDAHHNNVLVIKMVDERTVRFGTEVDKDDEMDTMSADLRPGILEMTKGRKPGDVLARLDLDPYYFMFRTASTHILAPELTEEAIRAALAAGHAYVSHDYLCDPTGFRFVAVKKGAAEDLTAAEHVMGDEVPFAEDLLLVGEFPVACKTRILKNGQSVAEPEGQRVEFAPDGPGVYRIEGWLEIDGELRTWVFSNPIYFR